MRAFDDLVFEKKTSQTPLKRNLLVKDDSSINLWKNDFSRDGIESEKDDIQSFIGGFTKSLLIDEFEKISKIGRGRTCDVYKVKVNGKICAVKSIAIGSLDKNMKHDVANELKILKKIGQNKDLYPHIIQLIGVNQDENLNIFIQLGECSLHDYILGIKENKYKNFTINDIFSIAFQIIEGIWSLHKNKIVHRDIKSHNILISTENKDILLTDFGSCKIFKNNKEVSKKYVGTKKWMAPEIHMGRYYDYSVDIWSYGATLIEILTLNIPYHDISPLDVSNYIKNRNLPKLKYYEKVKIEITENQKKFFENLIYSCLKFEPKERPKANEICEFLRKYKEKLLMNERIEEILK